MGIMSGLLDKANKVAEDKKEDPKQVEAVIEDRAPTGFAESDDNLPVDKRILVSLQVGGAIALLVSMFWLVQTGWLYATFVDYLVAITIMIFGWILYNASDFLGEGLSSFKMGSTAVVFAGLFITTVIGTMFMNAGGGVTIAAAKLDGANDEIDLSFYGPSGMEFTVEVLVNGEAEYSKELEIDVDRTSHSIDLEDIWQGNSKDRENRTLLTYEVKVTSEGGEDSTKISEFMMREVDTGYVKVTEIFDTDSNGNKEYTGILVEMIIGVGNPGANYDFNNGFFIGTPPKTIVSDWTATLTVKKGASTEYVYQQITADEGFVSGIGDFWSGWVAMPGTDAGNLARDGFYDGDGCYTFEVSIQNELGEDVVDSSSKIEFSWESNEAGTSNEPASSENC